MNDELVVVINNANKEKLVRILTEIASLVSWTEERCEKEFESGRDLDRENRLANRSFWSGKQSVASLVGDIILNTK